MKTFIGSLVKKGMLCTEKEE
ncbi:hypothetical protein [Salinicoccus halitifaciens]|nr:hypothetical protein [Salinicoccus halitifaciens]